MKMKILLLCAGVLGAAACRRAPGLAPAQPRTIQVAQSGDTVVEQRVARWNPQNAIAEVTILTVRVGWAPLLACVFGVTVDSTLVAFPGNAAGCGRYYDGWTRRRQPAAPSGKH